MRTDLRWLLAILCLAAIAIASGPGRPVAGSTDERSLSLYNIHNGERLTVVYKRGDAYVPEALEKLNWIFRDWRRNQAIKMDPKAFDILWEVYQELGSKEPVHIISGYRSPGTNEALRKAGGGQAKNSQHIEGKALDVHFPDVPVQRLRYAALVRERGGVGYYPTSALPFVHIDTGRVRMWPRMPRQELALLFPSGHSKYLPVDGRAITPHDVEVARAKYAKLAETIAEFHALRAGAGRTLIASLEPAVVPPEPVEAARPRLVAMGKPVVASLGGPKLASLVDLVPKPLLASASPADGRPSLLEQEKLQALISETVSEPEPASLGAWSATTEPVELASAPEEVGSIAPPEPRKPEGSAFLSEAGWARAPEFDDDHDDELSYRPFPIGPFLTADPDVDHSALAHLVHPDLLLAHEAIESGGQPIRLSFRQAQQISELLWADGFSAEDVTKVLYAVGADARPQAGRRVRTASQ